MSSSPIPPPPALSPRRAGQAGANTPAAIGLVLGLLALALDYLSLSNSLYSLGLGAVDNLTPGGGLHRGHRRRAYRAGAGRALSSRPRAARPGNHRSGAGLSQPRRVPGLHRAPVVLVLHDRMMRYTSRCPRSS